MKVAAYQAPLHSLGSMVNALDLIRRRVEWCEAEGVTILCCPEAILGGLADYAVSPRDIALNVESGQLNAALGPLASDTVATIVGFTEIDGDRLYNSAAVFQRGAVAGVYRKLHPAINRSVYEAGSRIPVFKVEELTFGIVICYDSNYFEPPRIMATQGATALFVPTNNGLPPARGGAELVAEAKNVDIARALENSMWVIRADVAGRAEVAGSSAGLVSFGSSEIVAPNGTVMQSARQLQEDLIVAEIDTLPRVK